MLTKSKQLTAKNEIIEKRLKLTEKLTSFPQNTLQGYTHTCINMENMENRAANYDSMNYTARVQKQHNSLVINIPKALSKAMNITKGDTMIFNYCRALNRCEINTMKKYLEKKNAGTDDKNERH